MSDRTWDVYLSGEIHTDWRDQIIEGCERAELDINFTGPELEHADSDDCGTAIFGEEDNPFWGDHKGAKLNAIRNRVLIKEADVMVVRFGEKYRQWNAAFDAGFAASNGTPIISLHHPELSHALKEIDAAALAVAETPQQVVQALAYIIDGDMP